jgi:hypothetical protein
MTDSNRNPMDNPYRDTYNPPGMTDAQREALTDLCGRYNVPFNESDFHHPFDLPEGWVAGQVGPIYVGCSPEGQISS